MLIGLGPLVGYVCYLDSCIQHQFIGNRFACEFFHLYELMKLQYRQWEEIDLFEATSAPIVT